MCSNPKSEYLLDIIPPSVVELAVVVLIVGRVGTVGRIVMVVTVGKGGIVGMVGIVVTVGRVGMVVTVVTVGRVGTVVTVGWKVWLDHRIIHFFSKIIKSYLRNDLTII